MSTECRVWNLYQARCLLCVWSAETTSDPGSAAYEASMHRTSAEHLGKLRERQQARRQETK